MHLHLGLLASIVTLCLIAITYLQALTPTEARGFAQLALFFIGLGIADYVRTRIEEYWGRTPLPARRHLWRSITADLLIGMVLSTFAQGNVMGKYFIENQDPPELGLPSLLFLLWFLSQALYWFTEPKKSKMHQQQTSS